MPALPDDPFQVKALLGHGLPPLFLGCPGGARKLLHVPACKDYHSSALWWTLQETGMPELSISAGSEALMSHGHIGCNHLEWGSEDWPRFSGSWWTENKLEKGGRTMRHILHRLFVAGAILAFSASLAGAQTTPSPSTSTAPDGQRTQGAPAPLTASPPHVKLVDGPVKKVDPQSNTISVGWLLGFLSTTLEVTEDTQIAVDGMKASLMDIREGDEVKASYEVQNGKNLAKSIEVTEAEPQSEPGAPGSSPATSGGPSLGSPQGAGAPLTGAPKTP